MKEKKFTPLMWFHLGLMVFMIIASIVLLVMLMTNMIDFSKEFIADETGIQKYLYSAVLLFNILAHYCCIMYLWNGYTKEAAKFYRAFMILLTISNIFIAVASELAFGFGLSPVLSLVKIILLLVLTFGQNLGKKETWNAFWIILAVDFVFGIIILYPHVFSATRVVSVLNRLTAANTIGLAVKGKYDDKDARGTV